MICDACEKEFDVDEEPGALVFSPPFRAWVNEGLHMRSTVTEKFHVCHQCWVDRVQDIVMPPARWGR